MSSKAFSGGLGVFLPNDRSLITGSRDNDISIVVILAGDDGGDPVSMSLEVTKMLEIEIHSLSGLLLHWILFY